MPMYDFICQICQRPFRRNCMSHVAPTVKCCSLKCRGLARRKARVQLTCPVCGIQYERRVGDETMTCGKPACRNKIVGQALTGRKKPHSPELRQKMLKTFLAGNHKGENAPNWQGGPVIRTCEQCGQEFSGARSYVTKRRFCGMTCYQAWKRAVSTRPEHKRVLARVHRKIHDKAFQKIAAFIRDRDKHTCQNCGKRKTKPALHVHHIIPARWFLISDDAHKANNLISLCGSCHIKIEMGQLLCPVPVTPVNVPLVIATRRSLWRPTVSFRLIERERFSKYSARTIMRFWSLDLACGHSVERVARYIAGRKSSHSPRVNRPVTDLRPAPHISRCPTCEAALLTAIR